MADEQTQAAEATPNEDLAERVATLETSLGALTAATEKMSQGITALLEREVADKDKNTAAEADQPKPVTIEQVEALLNERDGKQSQTAARQTYLNEKMSDLPDAYQRLMPDTGDAAKLAKAEQDVRAQFKKDFPNAAANGSGEEKKSTDVSGLTATTGGDKAEAVDLSKLSGIEKIQMGLESSTSTKSEKTD